MTGFSIALLLVMFVVVTRVAFRRTDMISALVIAFVATSFVGGLAQVAANGQDVAALQMMVIAAILAPVAALDGEAMRGAAGAVLLSRENYAGMSEKVTHGAPRLHTRHSYAA